MIELNKLVGQVITEEIKNALKAQYPVIRIGHVDSEYKTDHKTFRVNILHDENNIITEVFFG